MINILIEVGTRSLNGIFEVRTKSVEYRGMKIAGVRVTNGLPIKKRAEQTFLEA